MRLCFDEIWSWFQEFDEPDKFEHDEGKNSYNHGEIITSGKTYTNLI